MTDPPKRLVQMKDFERVRWKTTLHASTTSGGRNIGSLSGQLGHRDQDEMLKDNDTDFPGLDAEAEHSGK